jgi:hypothetical protein
MNLSHHGPQQEPESTPSDAALVVPLDTLDRTKLPLAGGKAANLGELIQAGFVVPAGFCVTTAAYARISSCRARHLSCGTRSHPPLGQRAPDRTGHRHPHRFA